MNKNILAATRLCIMSLFVMIFSFSMGLSIYAANEDKEDNNKHKGWDNVVEKFILHDKVIPEQAHSPLFEYYLEVTQIFDMVQVGELGVTYEVPICSYYCGYWETNDYGTAYVPGGFMMATTETTYELWYTIRMWALSQGYQFQNMGAEGSFGIPGEVPTEGIHQPVTAISFRDMIVWLNALSEYSGYDPVYVSPLGDVLRDSTDLNASMVDRAVQTNAIGYRLPTSDEWALAAKWKDDVQSTDGSIYRGGRYWTPHNYASGASAPYLDTLATNEVSWHIGNSSGYSHEVGMLKPNALGIYDMSGNMWETMFSPLYAGRQSRGGGWENTSAHVQVGVSRYWGYPYWTYNNTGFRFVINTL